MLKTSSHKKGITLFIVLAMVLFTTILANIILTLILNHYRLTHHQVSRIKAYYAGLAAMNLTREKIRAGQWTTTPLGQPYTLCSSGCTVDDPDIPYKVEITIGPPNPQVREINLKTTYTYIPTP